MTSIIDDIIAQHFAASRALHAQAEARRAAYYASREAFNASLHTCGPVPAIEVGALAPMSDYVESVRRGWSTD